VTIGDGTSGFETCILAGEQLDERSHRPEQLWRRVSD
jgi:hypothetical protein